jgi:ABC-type proline/glycine betaine transport system ATPase subunit
MQQRVGLARALAADPDILIMDEPFSALDPLIRRQLQDQFLSLSKDMGKTTLFITHDLDEAIRMGSRIAIMKDGVIVQIGVPEEIVTKPVDDYVADFVAGISRLKLVYAHTVMEPYDAWKANGGARVDDGACLQARTDTDLQRPNQPGGGIRQPHPDPRRTPRLSASSPRPRSCAAFKGSLDHVGYGGCPRLHRSRPDARRNAPPTTS